jgi:uncharacterized protein YkwD
MLDRMRWRFVGCFESLESRQLLAFDPSPLEQAMLEDINRMRLDPAGELDVLFLQTRPLLAHDADVQGALNFFRVDPTALLSQWSELEPVPPVAWNETLYEAARAHDQQMIGFDQQSHRLPDEPDLGERVRDAGYDWTLVVENVYAFGRSTIQAHAGFVVDWGETPTGMQDPPGHRVNIMNPLVTEVGAAIVRDANSQNEVGPLVITQDFATRRGYLPQVLGVVYDDRNGNSRYDAGEGLGRVNVEAVGPEGTFTTTTMSAGGYQLSVPKGTYAVFAWGGPLSERRVAADVVMDRENVKVDINSRVALRAPTALNDQATTSEDIPVTIDVLANDAAAGGRLDPASMRITGGPASGSVEVVGTRGQIRYHPGPNFAGTDQFRYMVRDGLGAPSNEALVTVTVGAVNDIPLAVDDQFTTDEDSQIALALLANDRDVDGSLDPRTLRIVSAPGRGAVQINSATAVVTYRPEENFAGTDSFRYMIEDNEGARSAVATVTITVRPVNDAPRVASDHAVTWQEMPVPVDVVANDEDIDGKILPSSVGITRFPKSGILQVNPSTGVITYTPNLGFWGADTFSYAVVDDGGALSDQALVSVVVAEKDFPWRNPVNALDVDNDGVVAPRDALLIINDLTQNAPRRLPLPRTPPSGPPRFLDTNRDKFVSAIDALLVINKLTPPRAANSAGGQPAAASSARAPLTARAGPTAPAAIIHGAALRTGHIAAHAERMGDGGPADMPVVRPEPNGGRGDSAGWEIDDESGQRFVIVSLAHGSPSGPSQAASRFEDVLAEIAVDVARQQVRLSYRRL